MDDTASAIRNFRAVKFAIIPTATTYSNHRHWMDEELDGYSPRIEMISVFQMTDKEQKRADHLIAVDPQRRY